MASFLARAGFGWIATIIDRLNALDRRLEAQSEIARAQRDALAETTAAVARLTEEVAALRTQAQDLVNLGVNSRDIAEAARLAQLAWMQDDLLRSDPRYADPRSLSRHTGQVYSQNTEDGIIAEIFRRIGTTDKVFVEMGVETGVENNTRLLLDLGWRGAWFEGNPDAAASIRETFAALLADGRLTLVEGYVTRDGATDAVREAIGGAEFDFLSLDIDYNTGHVWRAMAELRPRVACIEYNAHVPPSLSWEVPYDPEGRWHGTTRFGASLKRLEEIGTELGYCLVGCDPLGVNAFFVRADLCDAETFLPPFTAEMHHEPPRFPWVHMRGHRRHTGGL